MGERIEPDNELSGWLRCLIYSSPPLLDTIWLRGGREIAVNKSEVSLNPLLASLSRVDGSSPISSLTLPVKILNKQQDFLLDDLATSNFKCVARNSLGYSEACELPQIDKQALLGKS